MFETSFRNVAMHSLLPSKFPIMVGRAPVRPTAHMVYPFELCWRYGLRCDWPPVLLMLSLAALLPNRTGLRHPLRKGIINTLLGPIFP